MPPMVSARMQQQRNTCKSPPPVHFTPEERKAMLAELTSLEDVRVRAVRGAPCCGCC